MNFSNTQLWMVAILLMNLHIFFNDSILISNRSELRCHYRSASNISNTVNIHTITAPRRPPYFLLTPSKYGVVWMIMIASVRIDIRFSVKKITLFRHINCSKRSLKYKLYAKLIN